jgi:hypothetical protein
LKFPNSLLTSLYIKDGKPAGISFYVG